MACKILSRKDLEAKILTTNDLLHSWRFLCAQPLLANDLLFEFVGQGRRSHRFEENAARILGEFDVVDLPSGLAVGNPDFLSQPTNSASESAPIFRISWLRWTFTAP